MSAELRDKIVHVLHSNSDSFDEASNAYRKGWSERTADQLIAVLGLTEFVDPDERWWATAIQTLDENGAWQW